MFLRAQGGRIGGVGGSHGTPGEHRGAAVSGGCGDQREPGLAKRSEANDRGPPGTRSVDFLIRDHLEMIW